MADGNKVNYDDEDDVHDDSGSKGHEDKQSSELLRPSLEKMWLKSYYQSCVLKLMVQAVVAFNP